MEIIVAPYRKNILTLGFFLAAMLLHLLFTFAGFYGGDDINYARYAAGIADKGFSMQPATDHFQLRWSTIYITAAFYKLFGINAFTSTIFSFLSFAGCGILLHKILRSEKNSTYFLSMVLFFFAHSILFYMHRLLPDAGICLAVLAMYYCYRAIHVENAQPLKYGILFGFALLFGIITKETIIIALPLFLFLLIRDVIKKRKSQFWISAFITSLILILGYLAFFKITTGEFFYRYTMLQSKSYFNICSFDSLPFIYTLKRIAYELWLAMLLKGDLILLLPAVAAVIYRNKVANIRKLDAFSFLALLLSANFMSISFTSYVPMCHDPRHFIFLFPFAAIISAPLLIAFSKSPQKFIFLPLLFICATSIMFLMNAGSTKYLYLLFTALLSGKYILSFTRMKTFSALFIAIYILLFFINYGIAFIRPIYPFYWDHKKIAEQVFRGTTMRATVFSADPISAELNEFFLGFKTGQIKFVTMDSVKPKNDGLLFYLINEGLVKPPVVLDSLIDGPGIREVARENKVALYEVTSIFLQTLKTAENNRGNGSTDVK